MNNEEKILAMLGQMQGQLSRVEENQAVIEYEISEMKTKQGKTVIALSNIQRDQTILKQGQSKVQMDMRDVKEDIGAIKEDIAALQYNVGKIGTWAERVSPKVDIGVYDGD